MRRPADFLLWVLALALFAAAADAADPSKSETQKTRLVVSTKSLTFRNGTSQLSFSLRARRGAVQGNVSSPKPPFEVISGGGAFSLAAGQQLSVVVRFSPPAKGTYKSRVNVTSNANRGSSQSVSLIGKARGALPSPTPSGSPTPTASPTATVSRTATPTATRTATASRTPTPTATATAAAGSWRVIAWNDLGMHCMDSDYSVLSILPPFNVLHAQAIDGAGHLVADATVAQLTYEAVADPDGSINTTSAGKTNFWDYTPAFFGVSIPVDMGVEGFDMPGKANVPQAMNFTPARSTFEALGVPLTPYDDSSVHDFYPLMKVVAHDSTGTPTASTANVLPVSDEMDCRACHGSNTSPAAMPSTGWVNNPDPEKDYRLNILLFHDEHVADPVAYQNALNTAGYPNGLYPSAIAGTPVLCARCHLSNALAPYGITGLAGIKPLTTSVHGLHSSVIDPVTGLPLDDSANRSACYRCHPGSTTKCLRGAMGAAVDSKGDMLMQCQSCHGLMSAVGKPGRSGWLDEPACQNCHTGDAVTNNGQIRYIDVIDTATGQRRVAKSALFATNPDVPIKGSDLYRFSLGHGGLQCEACHGATHAEYPSLERNDNLQSLAMQGHVGMLADCQACHATSPGLTGGPHGLHVIGQQWVNSHPDYVDSNGNASCKTCHGTDYRGTVLSHAQGDRSFNAGDYGTVTFKRGDSIGCYSCHNGPNPD
jgi:Outer membrane cytochrome MtrC/MtrF-like, domains II/IV